MTARSSTRSLGLPGVLAIALGLAIGPWLSGCGSAEPTFNKETQYTPASLASEFLFRFKGMNVKAKRAPAPPKRSKGTLDKEKEEKVAAKSKEATKKASNNTLDDLLEDIAKKAETVKDSTPTKVLTDVAAIVGKDTFVAESDRKILVERLEGYAKAYE